MKFFKWFYESLGNSKSQRFWRLTFLIFIIGVIIVAVFNVGYKDGKIFWKPLDVSINKTLGD